MVSLATLRRLAELENEMAQAGRPAEQQALHEALRSLGRPERGFLTTGQAADRLQVSIPTVKRWVERGALVGGQLGGRWLVAAESVERLEGLRAALAALDQEGNPSAAELRALSGLKTPYPERDSGPASRD
ncbi:MAG TPA: helix-turn-helix domain-containing protein [Chloroflexota bacterium]|nr:helix-turn-helix domain-containing protein [Chloroflexota bacterium]